MSQANTACPVCGHKNIDKGSSECPQCNADLKCFNVLDSIPDREATPSPEQAGFTQISGKLDEIQRDIMKTCDRTGGNAGASAPEENNLSLSVRFRALVPGIVFSVFIAMLIMTVFLFHKTVRLEEILKEKSYGLSCEIRELSSKIADTRRDDIIQRKELEIRVIELKSEIKESLNGISGELKQAASLAASENTRFYQGLNSVSEKLNKEESRLNGIERQGGQMLDRLDKQGDRLDKQSERLLEMDKHYKEVYDSANRRNEEFLKSLKELSGRIENLTKQIEIMQEAPSADF